MVQLKLNRQNNFMISNDEFAGLSDEEVLTLLNKGVEKAFDCLYRRYRTKLVSAAFNRIKSKEQAEELVQDVFIHIWQKRNSLAIHHTFSAYAFTAVKYKVLDYISSLKIKDRYIQEMLKFSDEAANVTELEIEFNELDYHLNKSMNDLPEKCREVFMLSRFENYTVNQIAEKLNVSPDTAKYHISHALKKLRESLHRLYFLLL
jgi:RNA polymerase sigma-19 factor, ECF subfamily